MLESSNLLDLTDYNQVAELYNFAVELRNDSVPRRSEVLSMIAKLKEHEEALSKMNQCVAVMKESANLQLDVA